MSNVKSNADKYSVLDPVKGTELDKNLRNLGPQMNTQHTMKRLGGWYS